MKKTYEIDESFIIEAYNVACVKCKLKISNKFNLPENGFIIE